MLNDVATFYIIQLIHVTDPYLADGRDATWLQATQAFRRCVFLEQGYYCDAVNNFRAVSLVWSKRCSDKLD
jgi:hypothetical protein